jgi:hypothetical protein
VFLGKRSFLLYHPLVKEGTQKEVGSMRDNDHVVEQAKAKLAEAKGVVARLQAEADALLEEFNAVASTQPVDTARLLDIASKRATIVGTDEQPGKLARANGAVAKALAAVADASWELEEETRATTMKEYRGVVPEPTDALPVPTIVIVPLAADALAAAREAAAADLAAARWHVALLAAADTATSLLDLGCDRIRAAWERIGDAPRPAYSLTAVRVGGDAVDIRPPRPQISVSTHVDTRPARPRRLARTQEREFYRPILEALVKLGGRGHVEDILATVEERVHDKLKPDDFQPVASGETRWRNTAKWARKYMTYRENPALLNPSAPRGWWEITDAGRDYLRQEAR